MYHLYLASYLNTCTGRTGYNHTITNIPASVLADIARTGVQPGGREDQLPLVVHWAITGSLV